MKRTLFDPSGILELGALRGVSDGIIVEWLGQGKYAAKPYVADEPYSLLSEWLCADIASLLNLRIPARRVIRIKSNKWLGFEWRAEANGFVDGMEKKVVNAEIVPAILAFDVLVCNRDRHRENMLFQRPSTGADHYICSIIDHGRALIGDMTGMAELRQFIADNPEPETFIGAPEPLLELIHGWNEFGPCLHRIGNLTRTQLEDSVRRMPREWRPQPDESNDLLDFIVDRRTQVETILRAAHPCFPNLVEEAEAAQGESSHAT